MTSETPWLAVAYAILYLIVLGGIIFLMTSIV